MHTISKYPKLVHTYVSMLSKKRKRVVGSISSSWSKRHIYRENSSSGSSEIFEPSLYHALVVIFLEFFAWGLLTSPIITVLNETFPEHTFLMNGLIQGVKGILSFLSAPLIGALSDVWGRKPFLILTVTFTCAPIPLMKFSPWWYFAVLSISGIFSVTFSIVFAYVADVTSEDERSSAYGLVSATFAASLIISPAIGAYLGSKYSENLVIALASAIALLDVLFILVAMPESLPEKLRPASWGSQISWEKADPFGALWRIGHDPLILLLCITTFLSYLPEAGEYSSFFVYLRLVMNFSAEDVASYIALVGVLSVLAQTAILAIFMRYLGAKYAIMVGLGFELSQLTLFGFASQSWLIWVAGGIAAMGSLTYPAISSFASYHATPDQQGLAQGMITGIRGLCNGLGPALFGFIFYIFHVDLNESSKVKIPQTSHNKTTLATSVFHEIHEKIMPGPPFAFGSLIVILAILVSIFIPENSKASLNKKNDKTSLEAFKHDTGNRKHEKQPLIETEDTACA